MVELSGGIQGLDYQWVDMTSTEPIVGASGSHWTRLWTAFKEITKNYIPGGTGPHAHSPIISPESGMSGKKFSRTVLSTAKTDDEKFQ